MQRQVLEYDTITISIPPGAPRTWRSEHPVRAVNLTRQGVRDLNGPNANGTGYNGRRDATCMHKRDPQAVAKYTKPVLVVETKGEKRGMIVTKYMSCCMVCDTELGLADSFG